MLKLRILDVGLLVLGLRADSGLRAGFESYIHTVMYHNVQ